MCWFEHQAGYEVVRAEKSKADQTKGMATVQRY